MARGLTPVPGRTDESYFVTYSKRPQCLDNDLPRVCNPTLHEPTGKLVARIIQATDPADLSQNVFLLVVPHIGRLQSLPVCGTGNLL